MQKEKVIVICGPTAIKMTKYDIERKFARK